MRLPIKNIGRTWGLEKIELTPFYLSALRLKYALEALEDINGKVLEIGCGAGAFTRAIKHYRPDLKIVGCDIDPQLVGIAQKMNSRNVYLAADIYGLPFKESSFDAIVAFDVVEHLENPQRAFAQIRRVLREGGLFHGAIPLEGSNFTLHGLALKVGLKPKEEYAGHIQQFKGKNIITMLRRLGFSKITCRYSGHCLYQLADFSYFSLLALFRLRPSQTIEGYVEVSPRSALRYLLFGGKALISFLSFYESRFLKNVPGQIGHFTAYK